MKDWADILPWGVSWVTLTSIKIRVTFFSSLIPDNLMKTFLMLNSLMSLRSMQQSKKILQLILSKVFKLWGGLKLNTQFESEMPINEDI